MNDHASRAGLRCPTCEAALPPAFPGASIACACGHRVDVPGARPAPPLRAHGARSPTPPTAHGGGPYRTASALPPNESAPPAACPFCGNDCPPMVRICPHCDVRLENVRCQRCFSLQAPGDFACARCGHALDLEPLLDATDAPCPRCSHPLEVSPGGDTRVHECPRCGGMFVPREALAEILCSAEISGALREGARRRAPSSLGEVRYMPCPLCHASMNRVNFGRVSGVIVDVCKAHGTWFDPGELTGIVAFAAAGGLERTRARELEEERDQASRARTSKVHEPLAVSLEVRAHAELRLEAWRDLLGSLLFW